MNKIQFHEGDASLNRLTFLEFGFGRKILGDFILFEIEISVDRFCERFESIYNQAIEELRRDDAISGQFDPPFPGCKDYPSLKDFLVVEGGYFRDFLDAYFAADVLKIFVVEGRSDAHYQIRSLDAVNFRSGFMYIEGKMTRINQKKDDRFI